MLAQWRRWRTVRRLEREEEDAYLAWRQALYADRDTHAVFIDQPGGLAQIDAARSASRDAYERYEAVRNELTRMRETG